MFLSHSSRDKLAFVDGLHDWMTEKAGLKVWYDPFMGAGPIGAQLDAAIESSRAAVIVLSANSVGSPWVALETDRLHEEHARNTEFRIATVRLDGVDPPGLLKAFKHIEAGPDALSPSAAAVLMDSLFGGHDHPAGRSVYISRGWRDAETPAADLLCHALRLSGLRLVADCIDQPHYDLDRVKEIISGVGGLAAILPHRGDGETSPYIISEIDVARQLGLPVLVFAHADVQLKPDWLSDSPPRRFDDTLAQDSASAVAERYGNAIERFVQAWRSPVGGEHVFLGHSLETSTAEAFQSAHHMMSRITGLPLEVGNLVSGKDAQKEILRLIREAGLCVIDISNTTYENLPAKIDFALNSSIEAGIALGADKKLYLTCRGARTTPAPFMFRNQQVLYYETTLELIGILTRIATSNRRRVL